MSRLAEVMEHDTAGDPVRGLKWTRKTTQKVALELEAFGIQVSANTVARLLKKVGFALRSNHKKIESGSKNPPRPEDRDRQFQHLGSLRDDFTRKAAPVISVDTKKKELVGNFKNGGRSWQQEAIAVYDHDFRSDALGIAVPYSVYDLQANRAFVSVGCSHETPAFAVDVIAHWWRSEGVKRYPSAAELLILADCGGANGARSRAWKYHLQEQLCNEHGLTVTVCHYPPGASKWNPIEHRVFAEISKNWAGIPLRTWQTVLNYLRTTRTTTGLRVGARLHRKHYQTGEKISDQQMAQIALSRHHTLPNWNYTIAPVNCEVVLA